VQTLIINLPLIETKAAGDTLEKYHESNRVQIPLKIKSHHSRRKTILKLQGVCFSINGLKIQIQAIHNLLEKVLVLYYISDKWLNDH